MALGKEVQRELKTALDDSRAQLRQLYDQIGGVGPDDYYVTAVRRGLSSTQDSIASTYTRAAMRSGDLIVSASALAISNNFYRQQFAVVLASSLVPDFRFTFVVLPPEVIAASVYGTATEIRSGYGKLADYVPKSGTFIETVLDRNRRVDLDNIRTAVTQALTRGEAYPAAARRLKRVFDTSASNAMRIIRTEGHRCQIAGQYALTEQARAQGLDVVRQIDSVLDSRTRPQSATVDGRQEDDRGYFRYPGGALVRMPGNSGVPAWDINDREAVINVIGGVSPTVRRARDPVTGKTDIISYRSFDEWAAGNGLTTNVYGQLVG